MRRCEKIAPGGLEHGRRCGIVLTGHWRLGDSNGNESKKGNGEHKAAAEGD